MPDPQQLPAPTRVNLPPFRVVGLSARTSNQAEMSGGDGRIGPLWGAFMNLNAEAIPGVVAPQVIYSVYTRYESDHHGPYDAVLGREVKEGVQAPEGMGAVDIEAGVYLVFRAAGRTPDEIRNAWKAVYDYFGASAERAFTADFERYEGDEVQLYIAIP